MPLYSEVAYWQGNLGEDADSNDIINDFSINSSINIVPSSEESKADPTKRTAINKKGIICVLADRQAVAVGINRRRAGAFYNSIDGYENIKSDATIQWINDLGENGIIFYMEDTRKPEPTP